MNFAREQTHLGKSALDIDALNGHPVCVSVWIRPLLNAEFINTMLQLNACRTTSAIEEGRQAGRQEGRKAGSAGRTHQPIAAEILFY